MSVETTTTILDSSAPLRRSLYALLILISFGMMTGRVLSVEGFNGDNDRSRWATIRALVDDHTYVIGLRVYIEQAGDRYEDQGAIKEPRWDTIDKVLKPEPEMAW